MYSDLSSALSYGVSTVESSWTKAEYLGRLRAAMNHAGFDQTTLAAYLGVTQGAVSKWLNGGNKIAPELLFRMCKALNVSADSLLGLPRRAAASMAVSGEDFAIVPRIARQVGAGAAISDLEDLGEAPGYAFRLPYMRRLAGRSIQGAQDPDRWRIVNVARDSRGDSMMPTIQPGASLLIDRGHHGQGHTKIEHGRIYLVNEPDEGLVVKRVFGLAEGILLISDNYHLHPPRTLPIEDLPIQRVLVGRVRLVMQEDI